MNHWGIKSYENDDSADALDAGFDRVHGARYEELMDDRNPLSFDEVQKRLADPATLAAAVDVLTESVGKPVDEWDEQERLAFVGVVIRHAEFGVPISKDWLERTIDWLEHETIEWDEATVRRLRRQKELALLRGLVKTG